MYSKPYRKILLFMSAASLIVFIAQNLVIRLKHPPGKNWSEPQVNTQSEPNKTKLETVCLVSSSYGVKIEQMDQLVEVNNTIPYLKFYLFTNFNDTEWTTPGWTKIVTKLNYTRMITHSRYGKFMAWKEPQVQECKAVIYMDAVLQPTENYKLWRELAEIIATDETGTGLMQWPHQVQPNGVIGEFLAIKQHKKDVDHNIVKSLKWLAAQSDFENNATMYFNENFGYDPHSKVFQKVSQAFWDRYSLEKDSWRDQPLWAFMLHRYNVTPLRFPIKYKYMWPHRSKMGHRSHRYSSEKAVAMK